MLRNKYPIYIVSKGRWESRLTSKALHKMGVPHFIVIEEQEQPQYQAVIDESATLLILNSTYQSDYDTCDDLGDSKSKGPGPARNFAWDHANASGVRWHWVMDDNINRFYRLNRNIKHWAADGTIFRCMEDFVGRYINVSMAGPQYECFVPRRQKHHPFSMNTRIYSCNLIRNDMPLRWRGRYNEDTDLSLRMLKDGWCTVLFNAFLQDKQRTQTMAGGNTKAFYEHEGTMPKSRMQVELHPDVSKLIRRYGRWHHQVDYKGFRQRLLRQKGLEIPDGVNEYGMVHQRKIDGMWTMDAVLEPKLVGR